MIPDLEQRFLAPDGWHGAHFSNPKTGHTLYYGRVIPSAPKAIIVCVGGLSEFSEKYFELAHDMVNRGYAFWFMTGRIKDGLLEWKDIRKDVILMGLILTYQICMNLFMDMLFQTAWQMPPWLYWPIQQVEI